MQSYVYVNVYIRIYGTVTEIFVASSKYIQKG